jgi:hypothetical protein
VASGNTPFEAVIVIGKIPLELAAPDRDAVPLPLSVKLTPDGSDPVSVRAGRPVVVTVKLSATDCVKASEVELVIDRARLSTLVMMRPIDSGITAAFLLLVNHIAPLGPAVIPSGPLIVG